MLFGFTLATCIWDWYATDNNLRGTPRGSRKKPNAGRQPIGRLSTAVLCRGLEKNNMVRALHGHSMVNVNQTWPHCVNQMGKTHSKPLVARYGRGTACYVWIGLYWVITLMSGLTGSTQQNVWHFWSVVRSDISVPQLWALLYLGDSTLKFLLTKWAEYRPFP
jgi:hypothetical protein